MDFSGTMCFNTMAMSHTLLRMVNTNTTTIKCKGCIRTTQKYTRKQATQNQTKESKAHHWCQISSLKQVEIQQCSPSPYSSCETLTESSNDVADPINCPIWELKWLSSHSRQLTLSRPTPPNKTSLFWDILLHDQIK